MTPTRSLGLKLMIAMSILVLIAIGIALVGATGMGIASRGLETSTATG